MAGTAKEQFNSGRNNHNCQGANCTNAAIGDTMGASYLKIKIETGSQMEDSVLTADTVTKALNKEAGDVKANSGNTMPRLREPSNKKFETNDVSSDLKKEADTAKNIINAINRPTAIYAWPNI